MLTHILIAITIQIVFWLAFDNLWIGALVASTYFISREFTQAEYRWISEFGAGKRANLPWDGFLDVRIWNFKSLSDFWAPTGVVFAVALLKPDILKKMRNILRKDR